MCVLLWNSPFMNMTCNGNECGISSWKKDGFLLEYLQKGTVSAYLVRI